MIIENGITLDEAKQQIDAYKKASLAVAQNQEYKIGDRTYTRADADEIRKSISYWANIIAAINSANRPISYTVGF